MNEWSSEVERLQGLLRSKINEWSSDFEGQICEYKGEGFMNGWSSEVKRLQGLLRRKMNEWKFVFSWIFEGQTCVYKGEGSMNELKSDVEGLYYLLRKKNNKWKFFFINGIVTFRDKRVQWREIYEWIENRPRGATVLTWKGNYEWKSRDK